MPKPDYKVMNLPNAGIRVRYLVMGEGFPLVLVHGVGARLEDWERVGEILCPWFQVVCFDLRGHGESTRAPGPYSLELFASDLDEFLDLLGIKKCHLAGHSLGGMIVQRFAIDHCSRLNKLVILSAAAGRTAGERDQVLARIDTVNSGDGEHFKRSLSRWFTNEFLRNHPELIEKQLKQNKSNDPACYSAAYRVLATSDLGNLLKRITNPTLVMTGEEDVGSSPRMARLMADRIPNSEVQILSGLRHSIPLEAPDQVAGLMLGFLRTDGQEQGEK